MRPHHLTRIRWNYSAFKGEIFRPIPVFLGALRPGKPDGFSLDCYSLGPAGSISNRRDQVVFGAFAAELAGFCRFDLLEAAAQADVAVFAEGRNSRPTFSGQAQGSRDIEPKIAEDVEAVRILNRNRKLPACRVERASSPPLRTRRRRRLRDLPGRMTGLRP